MPGESWPELGQFFLTWVTRWDIIPPLGFPDYVRYSKHQRGGQMHERRQHDRVRRAVTLRVKEWIRGRTRQYRTLDVSSSGVFLKTRRPHVVGETVLLHYPMPGSRSVVRIEGEVVRIVDREAVRNNRNLHRGIGVSFLRAIDPQGTVR